MILCDTIEKFEKVCVDRHDKQINMERRRAFWDGAAFAARTCQRIQNGGSAKMAELPQEEKYKCQITNDPKTDAART